LPHFHLSLYTKGAAAGNWPKRRCKVSQFKGLGIGPGAKQGSQQIDLLTIVVITLIISIEDPGGGP
jgi:hypothetical protein